MMWMMLWMLAFWVAVIGGAVWLFAGRVRGSVGDPAHVLQRRLASGEIDVEEFRRREQALRMSERSPSRTRWFAIAMVVAVGGLVAVPVIAMAANGWEMWDMHGRGRNTSDSSLVQGGAQATVTIEDFAFAPGNLEVPTGAKVTWTNKDSAPHDATARNGEWQTERLSGGESDSLTFETPGKYDYYCSIHPDMKARLVVR